MYVGTVPFGCGLAVAGTVPKGREFGDCPLEGEGTVPNGRGFGKRVDKHEGAAESQPPHVVGRVIANAPLLRRTYSAANGAVPSSTLMKPCVTPGLMTSTPVPSDWPVAGVSDTGVPMAV